MELYWGPAIAAFAAIIGAWLSRLQNRDSKEIDRDLGVAKEQREGWSALLGSKDAEIVRLNLEVEKLRRRLDELADPDHAIAERDAIIAALVARLGPHLNLPEEDPTA